MPSVLNPYLSFGNNATEAMDFYHSVFGGELTSSTFAEYQLSQDPSDADLIMHSQLESGNGFVLMAADTPDWMGSPRPNGSISLSGEDEAELRRFWNKLTEGGTVLQPLEKAPWGDSFGMLDDKFGVTWLVNISGT